MKIIISFIFVLIFLGLINSVAAQSELVDINKLKNVAMPIHIVELALALFVSYMSLKFFQITKPVNLFLYLYISIGFFIINSLLYLFLYLSLKTSLEISFISIYITSRIALMGMLISFALFFYHWNKVMRKT